jgi:HEAT repeat protein
MTLVNHPGSWQQMALAALDAGIARDITLMLADVHAVLNALAAGEAPAAAGQAAAVLEDADSPCTLQGLADAVSETESMLRRAIDAALSGIPDIP